MPHFPGSHPCGLAAIVGYYGGLVGLVVAAVWVPIALLIQLVRWLAG